MAEQSSTLTPTSTLNPTAGTERYDPANDPKRKAKSKDPGWKYGFWPDLTNKDIVQCIRCGKQMHAGVRRLKQHLAGGYGDVEKCPKSTTPIMKEMREYLFKNARNKPFELDDEGDGGEGGGEGDEVQEIQAQVGII